MVSDGDFLIANSLRLWDFYGFLLIYGSRRAFCEIGARRFLPLVIVDRQRPGGRKSTVDRDVIGAALCTAET